MVEISADAENTVKTGSIEEVFEDKTKEDIVQTDWSTFISSKNNYNLHPVFKMSMSGNAHTKRCSTVVKRFKTRSNIAPNLLGQAPGQYCPLDFDRPPPALSLP